MHRGVVRAKEGVSGSQVVLMGLHYLALDFGLFARLFDTP
jgi:hypothetical protein